MIVEFFVAPDDDAAAAVLRDGPDGRFESATYGNFLPDVALLGWGGVFTGQARPDIPAGGGPRYVAGPDGQGSGPVNVAASGD